MFSNVFLGRDILSSKGPDACYRILPVLRIYLGIVRIARWIAGSKEGGRLSEQPSNSV